MTGVDPSAGCGAEARIMALADAGVLLGPLDRALLLAGRPGAGALPAGDCERALLEARAMLFGPEMAATLACSGCGETLEIALDAGTLAAAGAAGGPAMQDIAEALALPVADARRLLAGRIANSPPETLEPEDVDAIEAELEAAGAPGELELAYACPACGASGAAPLDPARFLWREIDAAADGLIDEVAALARAYGWSEAAVLALPPARRARYLERLE